MGTQADLAHGQGLFIDRYGGAIAIAIRVVIIRWVIGQAGGHVGHREIHATCTLGDTGQGHITLTSGIGGAGGRSGSAIAPGTIYGSA